MYQRVNRGVQKYKMENELKKSSSDFEKKNPLYLEFEIGGPLHTTCLCVDEKLRMAKDCCMENLGRMPQTAPIKPRKCIGSRIKRKHGFKGQKENAEIPTAKRRPLFLRLNCIMNFARCF